MGVPVIEKRSEWVRILRLLEEHGACRPPGWRIRQTEFAAAVPCAPRTLHKYVEAMERYGYLTIRRTTVDGSFASPRGFNIYRLNITAEDWIDRLAEPVIAKREERERKRVAAQAKNRESEKKRRAAAARPRKEQPISRVRSYDPETVAVLAAAYDDDSDEELDGW